MLRLIALVSAPALLMVALAPAAPVPRPQKPVYYFPTRVGDSWVVSVPGFNKLTGRKVVTSVEWADGSAVVTVENELGPRPGWGGGPGRIDQRVAASRGGLSAPEHHGRRFDPPAVLLRLPARPGEWWDYRPGQRRSARPPEEVTVGAGTFTAVPVDVEDDLGGGRVVRYTEWYAPNVGRVRVAHEHGGRTVTAIEMTEFTPGTLPPATK